MQASELMLLALFVVVIWYWLDAMRTKELARQAGRAACERDQLAFLDDTVVLQKIRLRRNQSGALVVWRGYDFEFSSDGSSRYKGSIDMLGKDVSRLFLEPHRFEPLI